MPVKPILPQTTAHPASASSPLAVGGILTGTAVAKLTAAGNAVWCDDGPDFIFNRLEVSGPDELLYDFIGAAVAV